MEVEGKGGWVVVGVCGGRGGGRRVFVGMVGRERRGWVVRVEKEGDWERSRGGW